MRILFFLLSLFAFSLIAQEVKAERLESDSYVIQFGNFNMGSGEQNSAAYNVTNTTGQTAAGPFGQYGSSSYFLGSGFQYIYQIDQFSFSISKTHIDLGLLTPGAHNTDSHTMTISTKGAGGYVVYAYEARPLTHRNGTDIIPNTTCDAGSCTYSTAQLWQNVTIGGFGFNMSGSDIPVDFINTNYFRPFANRAIGEPMQVVMSNTNVVKNAQSTVTYKGGLFGSEAAGNYETAVSFVAVPGY